MVPRARINYNKIKTHTSTRMKMRKFTEDHEWVDVAPDAKTAAVGITHYAQEQLGDIVYVQLPAPGDALQKGGVLATIESAKAASDILSPISGVVAELNQAVLADPGLINRAAESEGWLVKLKLSAALELDALLDAEAYKKHIS